MPYFQQHIHSYALIVATLCLTGWSAPVFAVCHAIEGATEFGKFAETAGKVTGATNIGVSTGSKFLKGIPGKIKAAGPVLDVAGKFFDRAQGAVRACEANEAYDSCITTGFSALECAASTSDEALCCLTTTLGVNPANPFSIAQLAVPTFCVLSVAYDIAYSPENPLCEEDGKAEPTDGSSGLYCCKYETSAPYCHTGFGAGSLNCTISYGPYNPATFCQEYAECVNDVGTITQSPEPEDALALESVIGSITWKLSDYIDAATPGSSDGLGLDETGHINSAICTASELNDLMTFRGCRGYDQVITKAEPYTPRTEWTTGSTPENEMATFNKLIKQNVAYRILLGMPNGINRYISLDGGDGDPWGLVNPPLMSTVDYVATKLAQQPLIDPETELKKWYSACAIEIIKSAFPSKWQLVALDPPPLGDEAAVTDDPALVEDACVLGGTPTIDSLTQTLSNTTATITVAISDPEYAGGHTTSSVMTTVIDWGDEVVEKFSHSLSENGGIKSYPHIYSTLANRTVTVWTMNTAGNIASKTVTVWLMGAPTLKETDTQIGTTPGSRTIGAPFR